MTNEQITELCKKKELELLEKYFGNSVIEAVITKPESIGEYTKDLPQKIESEYKYFLIQLWIKHAPENLKNTPLILEKHILRKLETYNGQELIDIAHKDAINRTLWERVTKTNHIDVAFYKGLLEKYSHDLLITIRLAFLEKITNNKNI